MLIVPIELLSEREDAELRRRGYKTFAEWLEVDRHVKKGQHAHERFSNGVAAFGKRQTAEVEDNYDGWPDEDDGRFSDFDGGGD